MKLRVCSCLITLLLTVACDSGGAAKPAKDAKKEAKVEQAPNKYREARLAKEKAKKEAEQKEKEALSAICVLPQKLPTDLDKACKAVAEAQDGFMKRLYTDNPKALEKWNGAKQMQEQMTIGNCKKSASLEVAACQKQAFDTAPPELKKKVPEIFRTCIEKFGKKDEGKAG